MSSLLKGTRSSHIKPIYFLKDLGETFQNLYHGQVADRMVEIANQAPRNQRECLLRQRIDNGQRDIFDEINLGTKLEFVPS